jgi:hypothetical protein
MGVGLLMYDSSRVIPVVVLSIFLWLILWKRSEIRSNWKNWLVLAAGMLIAFGPMLGFAIQSFEGFTGRGNTVMLWNPEVWQHEVVTYNAANGFEVILQQIWRTFLTLHLTGDGSPHFSFPRPMTAPLTAALFVLSLGYISSRIKKPGYFALISWVSCTFVLGGVLTYDPPYWPHLNITSPAIALLAALAAERLAACLAPHFGRYGFKILMGFLAGAIILTGIDNWNTYYEYVKNNAGPRIRMTRYLATLSPSYYAYMLSPHFRWDEYAFRFFNQGMPGTDLTPEMLQTAPPAIQQPVVFILFDYPELLPVITHLYPGGEVQQHFDYTNEVSFVTYSVIPPGYVLLPNRPAFKPLDRPGWWLILGIFSSWLAWTVFKVRRRRSIQQGIAVLGN